MFFVTLIIVSLFTVRLSDAILDSKIGALDRSLGFVFGVARGFILAVLAFAIFNGLVSEKQQPEWIKNARTRPILTETRDQIVKLLPSDWGQTLDSWIQARASAATNDFTPTDDSAARPKTAEDPPIAAPSPPQKKADSPGGAGSASDKQKLDALINKNAPFSPAPRQ